jgi:hypothetical protein
MNLALRKPLGPPLDRFVPAVTLDSPVLVDHGGARRAVTHPALELGQAGAPDPPPGFLLAAWTRGPDIFGFRCKPRTRSPVLFLAAVAAAHMGTGTEVA